jgi:hypothetical protein
VDDRHSDHWDGDGGWWGDVVITAKEKDTKNVPETADEVKMPNQFSQGLW